MNLIDLLMTTADNQRVAIYQSKKDRHLLSGDSRTVQELCRAELLSTKVVKVETPNDNGYARLRITVNREVE